VIIPDPKQTFERWLKKPGVYFLEKVGILRLDTDGGQEYHLRYLNEITDESKARSASVEMYYSMVVEIPPEQSPPSEKKDHLLVDL